MARMPRVTARQLVRALRRAGWEESHQVGSHLQLEHPQRPGKITVPIHAGETIGPKLLSNILRQAGMSADELRQYLRRQRGEDSMRHYTILLDYDADVDAYAVTVPALPGCFTQGKTPEEAVERAKEAIQCHLEGLLQSGEQIPDDCVDLRLLTVNVPEPALAS